MLYRTHNVFSFVIPCKYTMQLRTSAHQAGLIWFEWFPCLHSKGQYIVSGSDDGSFFIWEKETTNLVRILQGDESIVNCLQPHPSYCFLATSGIDPVVRLWNPRPEVNGF